MSDTQSIKKHRRQNNLLNENGVSLEKEKIKYIGPYEIINFIKDGSSSKIYLAKSQYTNENVVIKAINKSSFQKNLDDLLLITKQIETLKILKHRNIVTLYEIYESQNYIYLITEYCSGKDLIDKIVRKKRFSEEEALIIFFQLLDAFTYMHKMNICHRNIRTEHILFDKNNKPKIVGFGYSSFYEKNKKIKGAYGSLLYACPEMIDEKPYNPELADVYSLGVVLYVLICGYLPFCDEDNNRNKILISEGKIEFPKEMSNKLKDLLRHMLDKNPEKRYTFQKIIKHPWIKPYNESFFSQGINIYKTIFPVDERILNIIHEYNFDKEKVKNDLINNKFNIGTGLYKQIVRKLLNLKIKNISDLFCEEFNEYRDNVKNKYENGDKKYEEYIQKVSEKYNKIEDFVNEFKEREDNIVEQLIKLKDYKEEKINKNKLNIIDEENDKEKEQNDEDGNDNILNNNNLENNQNIEIIYNDEQDEDIDIIQQFQEEQNKKSSENLAAVNNITNSPKVDKESKDNNKFISTNYQSLRLTDTSEISKPDEFSNNILNNNTQVQIIGKQKNPNLGQNKPFQLKNKNFHKSIINTNILKSSVNSDTNKLSDLNPNNFRMTATRKISNKKYFDRGSFYDDYLKKNHPENIRKTLLKSKFSKLNENIDKVSIEDIKENDENESEKEENGKKEKELKYSFSFDDDDDEVEDNKDQNDDNDEIIDVIDGDGDDKLFNLLNNDDDEEMKELKKLYYGDNLKKSIQFLKKSILKKKSVKFKDDVNLKEKEKQKNNISNEIKRVGTNTSGISGLDIDKYEKKLSEFNKKLDIVNDKEEDYNSNIEKIRFNSQLDITIPDDNDEKNKDNDCEEEDIHYFYNDKVYQKKMEINQCGNNYDINDINNILKKNYIKTFKKDLPSKQIENIDDNNDIEQINNFFLNKFKGKKNPLKNRNKYFREIGSNTDSTLLVDESSQTIPIKNPKSIFSYGKFKIFRSCFSIASINNNIDNENYPYIYNGKNQININKKINPIQLRTDKIQTIQDRFKEFEQRKKALKYFKKTNNNNDLSVKTDYIPCNNSYVLEKTPNLKNKCNPDINLLDFDNYLASDSKRKIRQIQNNKSYIKRNKEEYLNYPNLSTKIISREKSAINSVKNLKNEVIVKRNEIIEKIQHCQNLLNTIKFNVDDINGNIYTYNKKINQISDFGINRQIKKNNNIINNNGINQIYKKNNLNTNTTNPNISNNKFTYKKINIRYLDNLNDIYTFDNMNKDITYNSNSLTDNNNCIKDMNNNNFNYMKPSFTKKQNNYIDNNGNLNNISFDAPNINLNKYKYNPTSYINSNTRKLSDNRILNKTFNNKGNDTFAQNIYKNKNTNVNQKISLVNKFTGYY